MMTKQFARHLYLYSESFYNSLLGPNCQSAITYRKNYKCQFDVYIDSELMNSRFTLPTFT